MATIPTPTVHDFIEINPGKYASVKHYELQEVSNGTSLLADQINISKDRKFAKSCPDYWLKIREGKKWSKPVTGLFKTRQINTFRGDSHFKKHLIILKFSDNESRVKIYYFENFFTKDLDTVLAQAI